MQLITRQISLLSLIFLIGLRLSAQQNGGMEIWSPSGSPPPFDWKFPTGWTTNNATTEFISSGVNRNNYSYSGEFSAQLKTLNIFGTLTRSQLVLGKCKLDYPNYKTVPYTGGEPLTMIPQKVSFFYQLTTGSPVEYAVADVLIKRGSGSAVPDTVYHQSMHLPAVDIFTEVDMIIPAFGINTSTDSIVIVFSSNDTNEVAQNILFVDNVVIDFISSVAPDPLSKPDVTIYPNPVRYGEMLTINHPGEKWHTIRIEDSTGRIVNSCCIWSDHDEATKMESVLLSPGMYLLIVDGIYQGRFVVVE